MDILGAIIGWTFILLAIVLGIYAAFSYGIVLIPITVGALAFGWLIQDMLLTTKEQNKPWE